MPSRPDEAAAMRREGVVRYEWSRFGCSYVLSPVGYGPGASLADSPLTYRVVGRSAVDPSVLYPVGTRSVIGQSPSVR